MKYAVDGAPGILYTCPEMQYNQHCLDYLVLGW